MKFYVFWTVLLSIIRSFSMYTQQWCVSYRFADSLRAGSGWNYSTCFRQFLCPSSGVFRCTQSDGICHWKWNCSSILIPFASCQQTCMTYTIAVCTVKNSIWWTEELSETCRVSFQNKIFRN